MRILILGGTSFIGRAIVEDALGTGADVTLFSRGKTGADLFPGLIKLTGDRDNDDYAALREAAEAGGRWDAVVDCSGYVVRHVDQAMDALDGRVGRYLFISSHAVYRSDRASGRSGAARPRPGRRECPRPRWKRPPPTSRAGIAIAASPRWKPASPKNKNGQSWPDRFDRPPAR